MKAILKFLIVISISIGLGWVCVYLFEGFSKKKKKNIKVIKKEKGEP